MQPGTVSGDRKHSMKKLVNDAAISSTVRLSNEIRMRRNLAGTTISRYVGELVPLTIGQYML